MALFSTSIGGPSEQVVVIGAGAAGMAAAISAARCGTPVQMIEQTRLPGGTVTGALIHTLGGLYDGHGELLNDGLAAELADRLHHADSSTRKRRIGKTWCLNIAPEIYQKVVQEWLAEESRIAPLYQAKPTRVIMDQSCVREVEVKHAGGSMRISTSAVIDTTGTGELLRQIDPTLIVDDRSRAAAGLVFRLRGVAERAMTFPRGIQVIQAMREAAADGRLPADCAHAWIDSGIADDEVFVKLFVPLPDGWQRIRAELAHNARQTQSLLVAFLRQRPDFSMAWISETSRLGVRDGGRIRGDYTLTEEDVRQGRTFADGICRCSWPIEYWDPDSGLELEYMPDDTFYEIPLRCLKVQGLQNAWAAGKSLSADHRAQASARVVGSCWTMGEAAGRAAAQRVEAAKQS